MTMDDFAKIVKQANILSNAKPDIIFRLLQALGAKGAIGGSGKAQENRVSDRSPSESVIKKWLNGDRKPEAIRYFPNLKVEDKNRAYDFLKKITGKEQWIKLRDLFREWHNNNQNEDKEFYIDTETDDFITFSTSFWRQFVSFFPLLRMWDEAEEWYPEKETNQNISKDKMAIEMIDVFKERYIQYKVYDFLPKEINSIMDSLYIYRGILDEQAKLNNKESVVFDCDTVSKCRKMYCKWSPDFDYFVFDACIHCGDYWGFKFSGESILLKFDKGFDYESVPTNTWLKKRFKYVFVDSNSIEASQLNDEEMSWKECQGEVIIANIDHLINYDSSDATDYPIIEDCYELIDGMLVLESMIDEFLIAVNEKIIKKYEGITLDDKSRMLYNSVKQYRQTLKKFKKNLREFRDLSKEKDEYLSDRAFIETFSMYSSFSNYEVSPKPRFPFSECYLDQQEADKVISCLCRCHEELRELYTEILNFGKNCVS